MVSAKVQFYKVAHLKQQAANPLLIHLLDI